MARNFVAASSQYLVTTSPGITDTPITMACWGLCDAVADTQTFMGLFDAGASAELNLRTEGNTPGCQTWDGGAGFDNLQSGTSIFADVWHHYCIVGRNGSRMHSSQDQL